MLTPIQRPPQDAELIGHVRRWLKLLAAGRLVDACAELDEPNTYGVRWTPESLQRAVGDTFGPGSQFRVLNGHPVFTDPDQVVGDGRPSVVALADGGGYSVNHDVPLNGRYSDLTAETEFRWRGGHLAFTLHDLHVL